MKKHMKKHMLSFDVAVIGGGPGGIPAALAAARRGAKVILVERNGHLGGNLVMGLPLLGYLDQNGRQIIGGIAQEFVDDMMAAGHSWGHARCPLHNSITLVHPEHFKLMLLQKCVDAGIELLFHSELTGAVVENGCLRAVRVMGKGTEVEISADVFVDATGDGDLAYLAGCRYEKGMEDSGVLQPPTVMFSLSGFEEEKFFEFLEAHPENMRQLDTMEIGPGYDTSLWRREPTHVFVGMQAYLEELRQRENIPVLRENIIYINSTVPGKIFVNTVRVPGCDGSDLFSLSRGEIAGHLQIPGILEMFQRFVPGFEHAVLDSISPSIGIRESRRFAGLDRLTGDAVLAGVVPADTIALGGYKVDIHNGEGKGTVLKQVKQPYGIPLGCLISADVDGLLLSGRCISMDSPALGSMRIMPTCMAIGEAAGVCAAHAVKNGMSVREVPAHAVTADLAAAGAILK